jgi:hypothetical protein
MTENKEKITPHKAERILLPWGRWVLNFSLERSKRKEINPKAFFVY